IALEAVLRAAEIAGNDWELHSVREALQILFGAVDERAQHFQIALVIDQLGRHGSELAAMEEIHEERLEAVVAMVAKHQGRTALFTCDAVEIAATQTRTE